MTSRRFADRRPVGAVVGLMAVIVLLATAQLVHGEDLGTFLRELDQQGAAGYAQSKIQGIVQSAADNATEGWRNTFGSSARKSAEAGGFLHKLLKPMVDHFTQSYEEFGTPREDAARFWERDAELWDTTRETLKEKVRSYLPEGVNQAIDAGQRLGQNAQWAADKIDSAYQAASSYEAPPEGQRATATASSSPHPRWDDDPVAGSRASTGGRVEPGADSPARQSVQVAGPVDGREGPGESGATGHGRSYRDSWDAAGKGTGPERLEVGVVDLQDHRSETLAELNERLRLTSGTVETGVIRLEDARELEDAMKASSALTGDLEQVDRDNRYSQKAMQAAHSMQAMDMFSQQMIGIGAATASRNHGNGGGHGQASGSVCETVMPQVKSILDECERRNSAVSGVCAIARSTVECMGRAATAAGGCAEAVDYARQIQNGARQTMAGACSN